MPKRLPAWFPKLSREGWMGLACVYVATWPILYFVLPVRPAITLQSATPVEILGFGKENQSLVTLGCILDQQNSIKDRTSSVALWDLRTRKMQELPGIQCHDYVRKAAIAPDGATIALLAESENLFLYNLVEQKLLLSTPCGWLSSLDNFSSGGTWFLTGAQPHFVNKPPLMVNTRTGDRWEPDSAASRALMTFAFGPHDDMLWLLGRSDDGDILHLERWHLESRRRSWSSPVTEMPFAVSRDGTAIAATGKDGAIVVLDASTGLQQGKLAGSGFHNYTLHFNNSGSKITALIHPSLFASSHGHRPLEGMKTWDIHTGEEVRGVQRSMNLLLENAVGPHPFGLNQQNPSDHLLVAHVPGSEQVQVLRPADGKTFLRTDLYHYAYLVAASPNCRFITYRQRSPKLPMWFQSFYGFAGLTRHHVDPWVIADLDGWGRTIDLSPTWLANIPTFTSDNTRVVIQDADHQTIHVWDLPARPSLAQMLLWSLVVNGPVFLVVWWWSKVRRQSAG